MPGLGEPAATDERDGFIQEWFCEPPPWGSRYKVRMGGDEWVTRGEIPVRRIYEYEVVPDAQEDQA